MTSEVVDLVWYPAFALDELPAGGVRLVKARGAQVAVFRTEDGALHAVDNRCPHEGYPLAQGARKDRVLTCQWHNFKFDLGTGACLMGDEDVRTFPVRVVDGEVQLDLRPPDTAVAAAKVWKSLEEGMDDASMGRVARDVVRLLQLGIEPVQIALFAARHDAVRGEWGSTHALPVAADVLRWDDQDDPLAMALPLVQALEIAARPHIRQVARPLAPPIDPGPDPAEAGLALREAVEREDGSTAEGLLRGAIAAGWGPTVIEPWLFRLCADHFLDFGHALIYQVKLFELIARVGWQQAEVLLCAHLHGIVCGTREDTLPAWAPYRDYIAGIERHLPKLHRQSSGMATWTEASAAAVASFQQEVLAGDQRQALSAVVGALHSGVALPQVIDQLSLAAAERMLRFDVALDADPTVQNSWLSVTHLQTFVAAVRHASLRWNHPDVLRLVLQAARMINRAAPLDRTARERAPTERASRGEHPALVGVERPDVASVLAAIADGDADLAVAAAARHLADRAPTAPLLASLKLLVMQDSAVTAIVMAHLVKNLLAAFDEAASTRQVLPVLAVVRLLASPVAERRMTRRTHEARRFVVDGKVPRNLVS